MDRLNGSDPCAGERSPSRRLATAAGCAPLRPGVIAAALIAFVGLTGLGGCGGSSESQPTAKSAAETSEQASQRAAPPSPPASSDEAKPSEAKPAESFATSADAVPDRPIADASASRPPDASGKPAVAAGRKPSPHSERTAAPDKMIGHLNPLDLIMPPVLLTDQQAATCLVKVGDQFPDLKLPAVDGGEKTLRELYGERLTLITFWKESNPYALEELADLSRSVGPQFESEGVKIIGINVQDPPDSVRGVIEKLKITFPILLDADGKAFQQVAIGFFPRTYAVDGAGKIVWFDIEYSRSTRRDLRRAMLTSLHTGQ